MVEETGDSDGGEGKKCQAPEEKPSKTQEFGVQF